ncbi:hypothetical protein [Cellulophaga omnivescoria]|uniref:hypothetical protein n=1 Tax=Cellulophaga omnivescoria TaxID=1888890 RepID=UPI000986AA71|nr:hypothetical protein [Cellulophaga omnivescoria]
MSRKKIVIQLSLIAFLSIGFVTFLFLKSEYRMHRNNAFVRRYPHHPVNKIQDVPIGYNSYYFAGYFENKLYLGNTTAPLHLLEVNIKTRDTSHIMINLNESDLPFNAVNVKLSPPYFFVMDGSVPCIYRGKINNWDAHLWMKDEVYFMNAIPIDSNRLYIKSIHLETKASILGLYSKVGNKKGKVTLNFDLLERQIDGVFDVDGMMVTEKELSVLSYVYYYRNQYLILDKNLQMVQKNTTIDTVATANISLSEPINNGEVKMNAPPLFINKLAALSPKLMFINSNRLGRYEESKMLKQASIIDVYNWRKKTYDFSFYFYNIENESLRELQVYENYLVGLVGNSLSIYELKPQFFDTY